MDLSGLMQAKKRLAIFKSDHPKMVKFIKKIRREALKEGTVVEIKVTDPDGKEYVSNMKITGNDVEIADMLFK